MADRGPCLESLTFIIGEKKFSFNKVASFKIRISLVRQIRV